MKQYRYIDFDCPDCGAFFTRFVYFDTDIGTLADGEEELCGANLISEKCLSVLISREMSGVGYMKTISKQNGDFNERERERLEKRADDHWKRRGRDEAIDRERAMLKKNGMIGGVK